MSFLKNLSGSLRGACLFLLLSSCASTRIVDLKAYHQSVRSNLAQIEKGLAEVDRDIAFHESILTKKIDPEQQRQLQALKTQKLYILQSYIRLKEDYSSSRFLGRSEISSQDAEFASFEKQQSGFKQLLEITQKQLAGYWQKSLSLRKYLGLKA